MMNHWAGLRSWSHEKLWWSGGYSTAVLVEASCNRCGNSFFSFCIRITTIFVKRIAGQPFDKAFLIQHPKTRKKIPNYALVFLQGHSHKFKYKTIRPGGEDKKLCFATSQLYCFDNSTHSSIATHTKCSIATQFRILRGLYIKKTNLFPATISSLTIFGLLILIFYRQTLLSPAFCTVI